MSRVKIQSHRRITLPKKIFEDLGLKEGDWVEVRLRDRFLILIPQRSPEDLLDEQEEERLQKALQQIQAGDVVPWEKIKTDLAL